jgi:hypothetical protein
MNSEASTWVRESLYRFVVLIFVNKKGGGGNSHIKGVQSFVYPQNVLEISICIFLSSVQPNNWFTTNEAWIGVQ